MTHSISIIPISSLLLILIPVAVVLWIQYKWSLNYKEGIYAVSRMLGQLLIVGYFLGYIFNSDNAWIIVLILVIMVVASSWIALRTITQHRKQFFIVVLISLLVGGVTTLMLVTQAVLDFEPWYKPQYIIPLAGMVFANSMNSISLAAERYFDEIGRGVEYLEARNIAFKTAMIPITNSLFAVGLVSLPGMMTGQILSGVDPLIAVRYQIMVMAMIFGAGGISSAVCLALFVRKAEAERG
jgi:putative ABC transport system permease protein